MKKIWVFFLSIVLFVGCNKDEKTEKNLNKIEKNYSLLEVQARSQYTYNNKPITLEEHINIQNMIAQIYFKSELKDLTDDELVYIMLLSMSKGIQKNKLIESLEKIVKKEKYKPLKWSMKEDFILIEGDKINTLLTIKKMQNGNIEILDTTEYTKNYEKFVMGEAAYKIIMQLLPYNNDINEKLGFNLDNKKVERIIKKDKYRNNVVVKEITDLKNGKKDGEKKLYDIYQNIVKKEKYNKGDLEEVTIFYPNGDIEQNKKYKLGELERLVKYRDKNIILEIIPSKKKYISYDENNKENGFIDEVLGTYEETIGDKKIIGKALDGFSLNKELKNNINSLKEAYVNLIIGAVKIETYLNDTLIGQEFYKNGINIMEYNEWHENGEQKIKGNYENGKKAGKWFEYNEKGQLIKIIDYDLYANIVLVKEGDDDGIRRKVYYQFKETGEYIGEYKEYYKNGKVKENGIYKEIDSEFTEKDGNWKEYNFKGKLIKTEDYSYGKLNSVTEYNYKTGIAKVKKGDEVKEYKSSKYNYIKENKEYYSIPVNDSRYIFKKYTEKRGKKEGIYVEYYENSGKPSVVGNYKNNLKDGEWKEYSKNGELIKTIFYIEGRDLNEIENNSEYDKIEFYPNGRIKYISNGPEEWDFEDKPIDFKSLKKRIDDITKEIKEYKVTKEDKGEHFSWQLSYLRLELEGLSLSKNLTSEEKEKLNNLIKTLEKTHTDAQRLWAN